MIVTSDIKIVHPNCFNSCFLCCSFHTSCFRLCLKKKKSSSSRNNRHQSLARSCLSFLFVFVETVFLLAKSGSTKPNKQTKQYAPTFFGSEVKPTSTVACSVYPKQQPPTNKYRYPKICFGVVNSILTPLHVEFSTIQRHDSTSPSMQPRSVGCNESQRHYSSQCRSVLRSFPRRYHLPTERLWPNVRHCTISTPQAVVVGAVVGRPVAVKGDGGRWAPVHRVHSATVRRMHNDRRTMVSTALGSMVIFTGFSLKAAI